MSELGLILRTQLQFYRRHPLISAMFLLGLCLGTALISAITHLNTEAGQRYQTASDQTASPVHFLIKPVTGTRYLPAELWFAVRRLGIRQSQPVLTGQVQLESGRSVLIRGVNVLALLETNSQLNNTSQTFAKSTTQNTGTTFSAFSGNASFVIATELAERLQLQQDNLRFKKDTHPYSFTTQDGIGPWLITDIGIAQHILQQQGWITNNVLSVSQIELGPLSQAQQQQITQLIGDKAMLSDVSQQSFDALSESFFFNLTALALLGYAVGLFLSLNALRLMLSARNRMQAQMLTLGCLPQRMLQALGVEMLLVCGFCAALGNSLGFWIAQGLIFDVTTTLVSLYRLDRALEVHWQWQSFAVGFAMNLLALGTMLFSLKQQAGHPSQQQAGHPSQQQAGHPSQQQTGHPPQQQTGHPLQQQTGHPSQQQTGHPPQQQTGHPSQLQTGHPSQQQTGHPSQQQTGHPSQQQTGHPSQQQTGHPSQQQTGHPSQQQTGHPLFSALFLAALLIVGGGIYATASNKYEALLLCGWLIVLFAVLTLPVLRQISRWINRASLSSTARLNPLTHWLKANTHQHLQDVSLAILAFLIALGAAIGTQVMVRSFALTLDTYLQQRLQADFYLRSRDPSQKFDQQRLNALQQLPQVSFVSAMETAEATVASISSVAKEKARADSALLISYGDQVQNFTHISRTDGKPVALSDVSNGYCLANEPAALRYDWKLGDTLPVTQGSAQLNCTISGFFYDYGTQRINVIVSQKTLYQSAFEHNFIGYALTLTPNAASDALVQQLIAQFGYSEDSIVQNATFKRIAKTLFSSTFAVTDVLNTLIVSIALIAIWVSFLSMNQQQQNQFGIVQALGVTPKQLFIGQLMVTASLLLLTLLLAIPLGVSLGHVLLKFVMPISFGWSMPMIIDWGNIAKLCAIILVIAFCVTSLSIWRLQSQPVANLIKEKL